MSTYNRSVVAVTNRSLCTRPFLEQVERVCAFQPAALILREKDLDESAYEALAADVLAICKRHQVPCILHSFLDVAKRLGVKQIQLPCGSWKRPLRTPTGRWTAFPVSAHRCIPLRTHAVPDNSGLRISSRAISLQRAASRGFPPGGWRSCGRSATQRPCPSMRSAASPLIPSKFKAFFPAARQAYALCPG